MKAAEITSRRPGDDEAATPVRRFVVIVGEPADGGSAFRIEDPARLLRVWSLLQATLEQLEGTTLPPEGMPGLQRQLQAIRRELERAVSPPLAAELRRIVPSRDAAPSAGALRIECAALASWVGSLVLQMLAVFVAARERAQQAPGQPPEVPTGRGGTFPGATRPQPVLRSSARRTGGWTCELARPGPPARAWTRSCSSARTVRDRGSGRSGKRRPQRSARCARCVRSAWTTRWGTRSSKGSGAGSTTRNEHGSAAVGPVNTAPRNSQWHGGRAARTGGRPSGGLRGKTSSAALPLIVRHRVS